MISFSQWSDNIYHYQLQPWNFEYKQKDIHLFYYLNLNNTIKYNISYSNGLIILLILSYWAMIYKFIYFNELISMQSKLFNSNNSIFQYKMFSSANISFINIDIVNRFDSGKFVENMDIDLNS